MTGRSTRGPCATTVSSSRRAGTNSRRPRQQPDRPGVTWLHEPGSARAGVQETHLADVAAALTLLRAMYGYGVFQQLRARLRQHLHVGQENWFGRPDLVLGPSSHPPPLEQHQRQEQHCGSHDAIRKKDRQIVIRERSLRTRAHKCNCAQSAQSDQTIVRTPKLHRWHLSC